MFSPANENTNYNTKPIGPIKWSNDESYIIMGRTRPSITISEFLEDWLVIKKQSIRLKTHQDYHRLVHKYILPAFGQQLLEQFSNGQLSRFYMRLGEEGLGSRTVRYIHSILKVAFKDAIAQGLLETNPTQGAILPRWKKKEMQILDEGQIPQFLHTARLSPYYGIYHFAIATGMRMGEILGLKWQDVDWTNATLFIRRQAQRVNGHGVMFQEPKTRAGIRKIKIQSASLEELKRQQKRNERARHRVGERWQEMDLIFPSNIGTPVVSSNLRRNFKVNLKRAGLPNIRFHDLRHTAATMMINHEVPIIVVSQILGHSKPSVTLDIYSHCSVSMQTQASLIMDELVSI
jgi:integrase